jgi:hypothetical protein
MPAVRSRCIVQVRGVSVFSPPRESRAERPNTELEVNIALVREGVTLARETHVIGSDLSTLEGIRIVGSLMSDHTSGHEETAAVVFARSVNLTEVERYGRT